MKLALALACLSLAANAHAADQVETIDAQSATGQLLRVSPAGAVLRADARDRTIPAAELAQVRLAPAPDLMALTGQPVLATVAGDLLLVSPPAVADGKFSFTAPGLGPASLDLPAVQALYLPDPKQSPANVRDKLAQLKAAQGNQDVLLLARDKDFFALAGTLKAADSAQVSFRWDDADKKVDRSKVQAIRLATVKPPAPPAGLLTLRNGSVLAFSALSLDESAATVATVSFGPRSIPRADLALIRFRCDRLVELSSLTPASVKQHGFFDRVFPYRNNRSVGGGPLRLGDTAYTSGLGLHSFCELSYDLAGNYSRFVAVVGIDQAVRPNGDAQLTILADGKPLAGPLRLTGKDDPQTLRLDLSKVRTLTLRVDFGPDNLDVSDHVDIAIARLIK